MELSKIRFDEEAEEAAHSIRVQDRTRVNKIEKAVKRDRQQEIAAQVAADSQPGKDSSGSDDDGQEQSSHRQS